MKFWNKQIDIVLLFWVLMIPGIVSCGKPIQPKKINVGQSNYFQPELIRTIAIMPLMHDGTDQNIADAIMHELAVQILRLDRFSMVDSYKVSALVEAEGLEGSGLSDSIVKKIGSDLKADVILLGKITYFVNGGRKYLIFKQKPKIGINLRMVSIAEAVPTTIWTLNDIFDSDEAAVQNLVDKSDRHKIQSDTNFLIKIVCNEIVKTLDF
jgi:hypothetical protein